MDIDFSAFENLARSASSEEGINARFYDRSIKTDTIDEQGFPVFKNVCFCEIRIKDNNSEIFDQPATEEKKRRFPQEYSRYLLSKKQISSGTPLEQFAFLSLAEVDSLKCRGIFTVESLSSLDDFKAGNLGIKRERDLARKFISFSKSNKSIADMQLKEEKYQSKIRRLEEEVRNLRQELKSKGE
ncbi:MAG: hypothetical protein E7012_05885 [Alphaproteobacteria bacterium]|nr:hypothetical protein [Alphaproteobacteria bacterium]